MSHTTLEDILMAAARSEREPEATMVEPPEANYEVRGKTLVWRLSDLLLTRERVREVERAVDSARVGDGEGVSLVICYPEGEVVVGPDRGIRVDQHQAIRLLGELTARVWREGFAAFWQTIHRVEQHAQI